MELNSQRILKDFKENKVDRQTTLQRLLTLISNSSDVRKRIEGIHALETIGIESEFFFDFFENLMISDSHPKIRKLAIAIIRDHYLDRAFEPMCWAYKHETSIECLLDIISTLGEIKGPLAKEYIINQLIAIDLPEFNNFISKIRENKQIYQYPTKLLAGILQDYRIIFFIREKFKRIQYKIQKGRIHELGLSFIIYNIYDPTIMAILPTFFEYLDALTTLDLRLNKLTTLPPSLVQLSRLKTLNLCNNNLRYLPEFFSNLRSLSHLNLSYNDIRYLPRNFGKLNTLYSIDLNHNQLLQLPPSFKQLQNLRYLNLHGNKLEKIPNVLFKLRDLTQLEVGLNELIQIQTAITDCSSLRKLCLGGNEINQDSLGNILRLKNLNELDLYDNKLREIPDKIDKQNHFEILSLHNNQLNSLPKSFKYLDSLESIDLSWNNFKTIPEELIELQNLKYIDFSGNKINSIPSSIIKLKSLKSLNLIYNKIHQLPDSLLTLKEKGVKIQI